MIGEYLTFIIRLFFIFSFLLIFLYFIAACIAFLISKINKKTKPQVSQKMLKQVGYAFFIVIVAFICLFTIERIFPQVSFGLSRPIQNRQPIGKYLDLIGIKEHSCGGVWVNHGGCSEGYYCQTNPEHLDAPGKCVKLKK